MSPCECEHFSHETLCPFPAASQRMTLYGPFRLCEACHAADHMVLSGLGPVPEGAAARRSARQQAEFDAADARADFFESLGAGRAS